MPNPSRHQDPIEFTLPLSDPSWRVQVVHRLGTGYTALLQRLVRGKWQPMGPGVTRDSTPESVTALVESYHALLEQISDRWTFGAARPGIGVCPACNYTHGSFRETDGKIILSCPACGRFSTKHL